MRRPGEASLERNAGYSLVAHYTFEDNSLLAANVSDNGALRQFSFPTTNPPIRFFRVRTQ